MWEENEWWKTKPQTSPSNQHMEKFANGRLDPERGKPGGGGSEPGGEGGRESGHEVVFFYTPKNKVRVLGLRGETFGKEKKKKGVACLLRVRKLQCGKEKWVWPCMSTIKKKRAVLLGGSTATSGGQALLDAQKGHQVAEKGLTDNNKKEENWGTAVYAGKKLLKVRS